MIDDNYVWDSLVVHLIWDQVPLLGNGGSTPARLIITRKVNDNSEGSSVKFIPETPGCKQAVYTLG